jgi:hypothetical protein
MTTPENGDGESAQGTREPNAGAASTENGRFSLSENHTPNIGLLSTVATPMTTTAGIRPLSSWPFMAPRTEKNAGGPSHEIGASAGERAPESELSANPPKNGDQSPQISHVIPPKTGALETRWAEQDQPEPSDNPARTGRVSIATRTKARAT